MVLTLSRLTIIKRWLYAGFGVLGVAAVSFMVPESTRPIGFALAMATGAFGVAMSAYLTRQTMRSGQDLLPLALHPSKGVFTLTSSTVKGIVARAAAWAIFAGGGAYMVVNGMPGDDPNDLATGRSIGAGWIVMSSLGSLLEAMAAYTVKRWGATPPSRVLYSFLAATIGLLVVVGLPLIWALRAVLVSLDGPQASLDEVVWLPVGFTALSVSLILLRETQVSRWQRKLDHQARLTREAEQGRKLAEAQLAMLQAQIEPHFLYNTLASVQYLVRRDAAGADFLLTQLIRYLRHAMPKMRQPMSTLRQEFELADAFLQIARMRMGGRLTVHVELAESLGGIAFPPLVLQTLVENALKHGVEPKVGPVEICVTAQMQPSPDTAECTLLLEVADNGVGLGRANTAGSGAGLANVRERLTAIFGTRAHLTVSDRTKGGVVAHVALTLPAPAAGVGAAVPEVVVA